MLLQIVSVAMSVYGLFLVASSHKKFPSRLRRIEKMGPSGFCVGLV